MKITASVAWVVGVTMLGIIGCMTVIMVTGHDVTIFVVAIGLLFTSATGFIALFMNQKKQSDTIHTIRQNTNGTLSRLLDAYERAIARENVTASFAADPQVTSLLHEHTLGPDEIARIRERIGE